MLGFLRVLLDLRYSLPRAFALHYYSWTLQPRVGENKWELQEGSEIFIHPGISQELSQLMLLFVLLRPLREGSQLGCLIMVGAFPTLSSLICISALTTDNAESQAHFKQLGNSHRGPDSPQPSACLLAQDTACLPGDRQQEGKPMPSVTWNTLSPSSTHTLQVSY